MKPHRFAIRLVLHVACALAWAAAAHSAELSDADMKAIRAVITEQLDAFAHDDGPRAFALATTGIRARFGTPEVFMAMVRTGYPVVYRPQRVQFDPAVVVDGQIVQPVRMSDAEGRPWIALYPMQRERDGTWRIDGCQLARVPGQEV